MNGDGRGWTPESERSLLSKGKGWTKAEAPRPPDADTAINRGAWLELQRDGQEEGLTNTTAMLNPPASIQPLYREGDTVTTNR